MKLFHFPGSRSLRVLWVVEEMGLTCETAPASIMQPSEEFLQLNPSRTIPVFVDGDAVITESVAAMTYIADRYGPTPLRVQPDEADYAAFLQFLILGEAGLAAPLNGVVATRFRAPEAERQNWTADALIEGFLRRLTLVDQRLQGRTYLAAERFTLADISVSYTVGLAATLLGLADAMPAAVLDHQARMAERPAYQRAAARQP